MAEIAKEKSGAAPKDAGPAGGNDNLLGTEPSLNEMKALVALFTQGRHGEAEVGARSLTIRFPRHGFGWKILGAVFQQQGRVSEALLAKQKAVALLPADADAHSNLGNALQEQGQLVAAEATLRMALALKPGHAIALNNLGLTLMKQGRFVDSEACLRQALAIHPEYAEAHNNLGITLLKLRRAGEAEIFFRRTLKLQPDYADAYSNLGNALQGQGQLLAAEASYRQALALKPHLAEAYTNLGKTLQELGRLPESAACHQRAIEIKPECAEAYCNLGNTCISRGELEYALAAYQEAVAIAPGTTGLAASVCLAILSYLQDNFALSQERLRAAKPILQTTDVDDHAIRVYWLYLDKLLSWQLQLATNDKTDPEGLDTLYVIGESHALAVHGVVVRYLAGEWRGTARWINGCKQWHLGNATANKYKENFAVLLAQIPPPAKILLMIGEIDCRHDEGILKAWRKSPGKPLDELIYATAQGYIDYVARINGRYRHKIIVGGVPAVNLPEEIVAGEGRRLLVHVVRTMNAMLKDLAIAAGMDFLDLYALTDRGDGFATGAWHLDNHHLRPDAYVTAFASCCLHA